MLYKHFENHKIDIKKLTEDAILPTKAHINDSGYDLYSNKDILIHPGFWELVTTGIAVRMPLGIEGCVRPRSGLALKNGITVLNTPGTIDNNYRGEIGVILFNAGKEPFRVKKGDRIAQLVFQIIPRTYFNELKELDDTDRGSGGFGSTGG